MLQPAYPLLRKACLVWVEDVTVLIAMLCTGLGWFRVGLCGQSKCAHLTVVLFATAQDRNLVALPLKLWNQKSTRVTNLTILRRFEFRSQLLRSGVIARGSAESSDRAFFFIRGAPEAIEQVVSPSRIPADYRQVGAGRAM